MPPMEDDAEIGSIPGKEHLSCSLAGMFRCFDSIWDSMHSYCTLVHVPYPCHHDPCHRGPCRCDPFRALRRTIYQNVRPTRYSDSCKHMFKP